MIDRSKSFWLGNEVGAEALLCYHFLRPVEGLQFYWKTGKPLGVKFISGHPLRLKGVGIAVKGSWRRSLTASSFCTPNGYIAIIFLPRGRHRNFIENIGNPLGGKFILGLYCICGWGVWGGWGSGYRLANKGSGTEVLHYPYFATRGRHRNFLGKYRMSIGKEFIL